MKVIEQHPIPMANAREILDKTTEEYNKENKELYYEQKKAIDNLHRFTKLSPVDAKKLKKGLSGLSFNINEEQIVKICDLLPEDADDVRAILGKERFKYNEEEIKQILDVVAQYR